MRARTLVLLIVLILIGAFAIVNWKAIIAPTALSFIVADVQAPLGLILLTIAGLLTVLFLLYLTYLQTAVLFDTRRHTRELQAQRELADQAAEAQSKVTDRLEQVQRDLSAAMSQTETSLSAYIGELEDRMERTDESRKSGRSI